MMKTLKISRKNYKGRFICSSRGFSVYFLVFCGRRGATGENHEQNPRKPSLHSSESHLKVLILNATLKNEVMVFWGFAHDFRQWLLFVRKTPKNTPKNPEMNR